MSLYTTAVDAKADAADSSSVVSSGSLISKKSFKEMSARKQVAINQLQLKLKHRSKNLHQRIEDKLRREQNETDLNSVISETSGQKRNWVEEAHADLNSLSFNGQVSTGDFSSTYNRQDDLLNSSANFDEFSTTAADFFGIHSTQGVLVSSGGSPQPSNMPADGASPDPDQQFAGRSLKKRTTSNHDSDNDDDFEDVKPYSSFMLNAATKTLNKIRSFASMSTEINMKDSILSTGQLQDFHSSDNRMQQLNVRDGKGNRSTSPKSKRDAAVIKRDKQTASSAQSLTSQGKAAMLLIDKPKLLNSFGNTGSLNGAEGAPSLDALKEAKRKALKDGPTRHFGTPVLAEGEREKKIANKLNAAITKLFLGTPKKVAVPITPEPWKPPNQDEVFPELRSSAKKVRPRPELDKSFSTAEYRDMLSAGLSDSAVQQRHHSPVLPTSSPQQPLQQQQQQSSTMTYLRPAAEPPAFSSSFTSLTGSGTPSTPGAGVASQLVGSSFLKASKLFALPQLNLQERSTQRFAEDGSGNQPSGEQPYESGHAKRVANLDVGKSPVLFAIQDKSSFSGGGEYSRSFLKSKKHHEHTESWHLDASTEDHPVSATAYDVLESYTSHSHLNSRDARTANARRELFVKLQRRYEKDPQEQYFSELQRIERAKHHHGETNILHSMYNGEMDSWAAAPGARGRGGETTVGPDNPVRQLNDTWSAYWDGEAGATYYFNHQTGVATWLLPEGVSY